MWLPKWLLWSDDARLPPEACNCVLSARVHFNFVKALDTMVAPSLLSTSNIYIPNASPIEHPLESKSKLPLIDRDGLSGVPEDIQRFEQVRAMSKPMSPKEIPLMNYVRMKLLAKMCLTSDVTYPETH